MKRWLLVLAALLTSLCQAQQTVEFADGKVEVVLPADFKVVDRSRQELIATFGDDGHHKVRLVFIGSESGPEDVGEQFIRQMNQDKGRLILERPGKVAFMDPAVENKSGEAFRTIRWQVGFGRSVVVIYLTAPWAEPMSPALKEFLGSSINALIASLRRRGV